MTRLNLTAKIFVIAFVLLVCISICGCNAHLHSIARYENVAPTCTQEGKTIGYCECGQIIISTNIDAKGHAFSEWEYTIESTCSRQGERKHTCSVCGAVEVEKLEYAQHDLQHSYGKKPTQTESGWAEYDFCYNCDYTTYLELPPLGTQATFTGLPVEHGVKTVSFNEFWHNKTLNNYYVHSGVDYAGEQGAKVYAIADGRIVEIDVANKLDANIVIDHGNGLRSFYYYVTVNPNLSIGDEVKKGQAIACLAEYCGMEHKDGVHLHLEMKLYDSLVDPESYLALA